jgi:hypothetical protein
MFSTSFVKGCIFGIIGGGAIVDVNRAVLVVVNGLVVNGFVVVVDMA